ncbi:FecR family protein [Dyadobacter tibetensis]|uniref:FecR family protein n=1 Tax=Dyadobacter tibetensis TaxID=1211851 RepID=UPI00046FDC6C|nr:FecR domain-containing protein [Dyadobacter tibetensis]
MKRDNEQSGLKNLVSLMKSLTPIRLSGEGKAQLWDDIAARIDRKRRRQLGLRWTLVAASLLLLLWTGFQFLGMRSVNISQMQNLAEGMVVDTGQAALILADSRVITLERQHSEIEHQKDGQQIKVDKSLYNNSVSPVASQGFNRLVVPYGKRSVITLEDGSKIWLNSGSKLVYPEHFGADSRTVYLEGQAYFDVSHREGKPFYVHTRELQIKVLGTEFDVSAYGDETEARATLAEGSIVLSLQNSDLLGRSTKTLRPGTQVRYDAHTDKLTSMEVNVAECISWKDGFLILNKAQLAEILRKLARYYKVEIEVNDSSLSGQTFSGTLDLADSVEQVMQVITTTTGTTFHKTERGFLLDKKHYN